MEEIFSIQKCPNCNGYGTIGRDRLKCPTCKGKGIIVIDNMTGKLIINDDNETKKNLDENLER
jgi:DnaJ-class molecular chaperone